MADDAKDAWAERVLGFRPSGATTEPRSPDLRAIIAAGRSWRDASDTVDAQIATLQRALLAEDDDELHEVAEFGLNGVTGGYKVKLLAALMTAEQGDVRGSKTLAGVIPDFRKHLESDERVEACDENPFGVAMSVRATLVPALAQLERAVGAPR